ncbi:MAG: hypothetical protein HY518_04760 [Candidatus Aenigmarchaeota archaeon]|nr:hypothetical protein [Candidatus Aenigmarchaeota archaeon]
MLKITLLAAFLVLVLAMSAYGQPVDVQIDPRENDVMVNSPVEYTLTIKNNQNKWLEAIIAVYGVHLEWVTPPDFLVVVAPNSAEERKLTFYPTGRDRGAFTYNIVVGDRVDENAKDSDTLRLFVKDPFEIRKFSVEKSGPGALAKLDFRSLEVQNLNIIFEAIDASGNKVAVLNTELKDVIGERAVSEIVPMPETAWAGEYTIKASVKGHKILYDISDSAGFTLEPVRNVVESEKRTSSVFYDTVTVTVTNLGNVESQYTVERAVPSDLVTGFVTNPSGCSDAAGSKTCRYALAALQPGQSAEVVYRVEYWPKFAPIAAIAIIVLVVAAGSYVRYTRPVIRKRVVSKGSYTYSVILEIRNPVKQLKDVFISDFVPQTAVVEEEFESAKPHLNATQTGTELVWKLGDLTSSDHRILAYRIKSALIGGTRMPRAQLRYIDAKGTEKRLYSNEGEA